MLPDMQFSFVARNGDLFSFFRTNQPPSSQAVIDTNDQLIKAQFGVRVRNAKYSNQYNCHGLTFISRLGRFAYFQDDVTKLLAAHDYTQIGGALNMDIDELSLTSKIERGDVIVYYDNLKVQHTGIIWTTRKVHGRTLMTVLSKWGDLSEYFHDYRIVPSSYGKTIQIWTDRRI